jgi:hypothetical protein
MISQLGCTRARVGRPGQRYVGQAARSSLKARAAVAELQDVASTRVIDPCHLREIARLLLVVDIPASVLIQRLWRKLTPNLHHKAGRYYVKATILLCARHQDPARDCFDSIGWCNCANTGQIEGVESFDAGIEDYVTFSEGKEGLTKVTLAHSNGTKAEIHLFGGCITSWKQASSDEILFIRPDAKFDGSKPISGGIPHCFPQVRAHPLQQHDPRQ